MISRSLTILLVVVFLVPVAHACTAFVVYRNGLALAGNNEDFWLTDTKVWFVPKEGSKRGVAGKLGRVYFGFNNFFPQGGMNEAGLFFDGFAATGKKVKKSKGKPRFDGNITDYVMANCKTVAEVVAVFEKYDLSFLTHAMLMFGDQFGDSVIIEGDEFLRIKGDHQVVTNFYQSLTPLEKCNCDRYKSAIKALGRGEPISVKTCRDLLAKTQQNGRAPTQYSNVYDLKKGLVYLYHFQNFEEVVCINLREELEKGPHEIDLPTLFSKNERFEAFKSKRAQDLLEQTNAKKARDIDPSTFAEFVGSYAFDVGQKQKVNVRILVEDNRIFVESETDGKREEIHPEAKDRFFQIGDDGLQTFVFRRNGDEQITGVTLKVFGRTYRGTKQK